MTTSDTRQRILDTAERLFAERGFAETSLRTLTREAGVNLAAVHYHFGSKEQLFVELLSRIVAPVNAERLARFDAIEAADGEPDLDALIRAFLEPAMALTAGEDARAETMRQLIGRMQAQRSSMHEEVIHLFREVIDRFLALLARALPHLDRPTLLWRMHFLVGAMCFSFADPKGVEQMSGGACRIGDGSALVDEMVASFAGAFRAPEAARSTSNARPA